MPTPPTRTTYNQRQRIFRLYRPYFFSMQKVADALGLSRWTVLQVLKGNKI